MLKKIELIVAGNNPNATFSNYIKKLASDYENIHFLGYVENLDSLFIDTDIQIVCSQFLQVCVQELLNHLYVGFQY